jgi:hypothetical protein
MARAPQPVRLQKTLKEGLRRCVYRRWEATVKGAVLITKTTELERMYRGNTPYPVGQVRETTKSYPIREEALRAMLEMSLRRRRAGYEAVLTTIR